MQNQTLPVPALRRVVEEAAKPAVTPLPGEPRFYDWHAADGKKLRAELEAGLARRPAMIPPKYFYDELGSTLFAAICETREYYPTRTEASIFETCRTQIAAEIGPGRVLIDLGAGDCRKAAGWFDALDPAAYVAVDISVDFVRSALDRLHRQYPKLPKVGLGLDFSSEFRLPDTVPDTRRLFFYPGSSIGNFAPRQARELLARWRRACDPDGGLLIGIDLVKTTAVLEAAYDDRLGITASFNRNVLNHVNRILGSDFDIRDWEHVALFNSVESRIEMYLEARRPLQVRWPGGERRFALTERIHTENSYKYTAPRIAQLLAEAGWQLRRTWTDPRQWFSVTYATPA